MDYLDIVLLEGMLRNSTRGRCFIAVAWRAARAAVLAN
jgi:hypothetical protein